MVQPLVNFTVITVAGLVKFVVINTPATPLLKFWLKLSPASVEIVSVPLPVLVPAFRLKSTEGVVKRKVAWVTWRFQETLVVVSVGAPATSQSHGEEPQFIPPNVPVKVAPLFPLGHAGLSKLTVVVAPLANVPANNTKAKRNRTKLRA